MSQVSQLYVGEGEDFLSRVIGCTPLRLEEAHLEELRSLIDRLPADVLNNADNEKSLERFEKLVQLYGDEPQLIDPILPKLVDALVEHIRWPSNTNSDQLCQLTKAALIRLRALSSVRGYKYLMRFLPHKIQLLEPILILLEQQVRQLASLPAISSSTASPSTARLSNVDKRIVHILTVWLLIICKNPFHLARVQTSKSQFHDDELTKRIIVCLDVIQDRMITIGELAVVPTLLAQILTRNPDNRGQLTTRFDHFYQIFHEFQSELDGGRVLISQLCLANSLLKWGRRHEIRPFALVLLRSLSPEFLRAHCPNILARNLIAKLFQRIALVLLKPRLAPWRYKCGYRSLEENLRERKELEENSISEHNVKNNSMELKEEESSNEEAEEEVPYDEVEMLMAELLLKIRDRDNMVRWTAAKGVARICARIPLQMAAEVVVTVQKDCFQQELDANAWHGGCLALAELSRRGCLLPGQVPAIISSILAPALVFEQSQIGFMSAVNVRDAACYICWAFARAYEASLLHEHLRPMAGTLISIALFDREINVRRAASAAFQENVGRNNSFPNGIQVLQLVDYIEVSRIRHCYHHLAVQVAKFTDYIRPMLDHLCALKSQHWDESVRELAADALQRLAPIDSEYAYSELLPTLCRNIQSVDDSQRHGTFFALAALLMALAASHNVLVHREQLITAIFAQANTLKSYRNKGFFLVGKSICRLIQALCTIGCELNDEQLAKFHDILDRVVGDTNERVAQHAVTAFPPLMAYYMGRRFSILLQRIQSKYFYEIDGPSQSEQTRRSCILPLAHVHVGFLGTLFEERIVAENGGGAEFATSAKTTLAKAIIDRLIQVILDRSTPKWVFARVSAIETIGILLTKHITEHDAFWDWIKIFGCLIVAADDYTATTNGDIGRFARRAAIESLGQLLPLAYSSTPVTPPILQDQLDLAIGKIVERACESIDDLRERACTVLSKISDLGPDHPLSTSIKETNLLRLVFVISVESNACYEDTKFEFENGKLFSSMEISQQQNGELADKMDSPRHQHFSSVDWRHAQGFSRLAPLLDSSCYGHFALSGFVLSAGSVCGWTSENAFLAIAAHLRPHKRDTNFLESFLSKLLSIHGTICARGGDPSPVLILFRMLLNDTQLQQIEQSPDQFPAFTRLCEEAIKLTICKGKPKVKSLAVSVLGSLLQINRKSRIYQRVLLLLLSLLDSPYVSLREQAVEQLFEAISLSEDYDNSKQQAVELLSTTDWTGPREHLAEKRKSISALLLEQDSA